MKIARFKLPGARSGFILARGFVLLAVFAPGGLTLASDRHFFHFHKSGDDAVEEELAEDLQPPGWKWWHIIYFHSDGTPRYASGAAHNTWNHKGRLPVCPPLSEPGFGYNQPCWRQLTVYPRCVTCQPVVYQPETSVPVEPVPSPGLTPTPPTPPAPSAPPPPSPGIPATAPRALTESASRAGQISPQIMRTAGTQLTPVESGMPAFDSIPPSPSKRPATPVITGQKPANTAGF